MKLNKKSAIKNYVGWLVGWLVGIGTLFHYINIAHNFYKNEPLILFKGSRNKLSKSSKFQKPNFYF